MELLNKLISVVQFSIAHYQEIVLAAFHIVGDITALCASLIAFFTLIPGPHPEQEIEAFSKWISKISMK